MDIIPIITFVTQCILHNKILINHFYSDFPHNIQVQNSSIGMSKKKKKLADKILPQKVRDLVPESQAYMDLLAFERKLDSTIMRKRLDIQVIYSYYYRKFVMNFNIIIF
jgi:hypothetical protein